MNATKLFRLFLAIVAFVEISLTACAFDIDLAIKDISAAPKWVSMGNEKFQMEGAKLIQILMQYTDLDPKEARNLVDKLSVPSGSLYTQMDIAGKIYIFNRLYCNVPDKSEMSDWKVFGDWRGVTVTQGRINSLFPLSKNKRDRLELTGHFHGYFGAPYRGLSEFDFLMKRFGRRKHN